MRLQSFAGITLPDPDAEDDFPIVVRSSLVGLQNGGFDQDGTAAVLKNSTIRRRTMMVGSRLDEQADTLYATIGRGRSLMRAVLRDNRQRVTYAKFTGLTRPVKTDDYDVKQPVTFTWSQDWPFWLDNDHQLFFDDGHTFDSGLTFDGNYTATVMTASPHTWSVAYTGTARGTYGAFCIQPRAASSITGLVITNLTNGLQVAFSGTVAASTRLDINWLRKTCYNASSNAIDEFSLPNTKQVEWMALESFGNGGNNFRITGTIVGTVDVFVQWSGMYY